MLIAILVFGATLGFVGVLLAVPLGAIFRVSLRRLLAYRAAVDRERAEPATPAPAGGTDKASGGAA